MDAAAAAELAEEGSDDGDWEDESNVLDLGLGTTKADLMAFTDEGVSSVGGFRQRDDETQAYLVGFFRDAAAKPGFAEEFASLTPEEQEKLRAMS